MSLQALIAMQDPLEQQFIADRMLRAKPALLVPKHVHTEQGEFSDVEEFRRFMQAGNATFTIQSRKSGTRFTFKVTRPEPEQGRERPMWVKLLTGSDNVSDYTFIGTIWDRSPTMQFNIGRKASITDDAESVKALRWMCKLLSIAPQSLLTQARVWHEGRCGRCGRKLTVPSSIANGIGPECEKHM